MSISEQELFGLMAVTKEQQRAVSEALQKLEDRQVALNAVIARAGTAVEEMHKAGQASSLIIEKATRVAVEKAVQAALANVQQQTQSTLGDSVNPAVKALQGVTARAEKAEESLHQAASSISWKWAAIWAATSCVLLASIVALSMLLVPSPNEIADLRAAAAALEAQGGRVQLSVCGDSKRLCARIDPKAEKGDQYGQNGQRWMILQGY
ncbi:hypothetical protein [Pseudomonas weihenstephanensis]|uniref:hypothetical protein n=1 Tax=Pseudomonas weihenstephanensis TaxID=1608994 RepID=UPI00193BCF3D|nr:hypothetical protein [Pseudomonas weihenstephanensis]MBM1193538.1 hypothetical protein [Pseudomonas weihenstephanensis]